MLQRLGATLIVLGLLGACLDLLDRAYIRPVHAQAGVQFDVTATNTGTTAAVAATLPASSVTGRTTYICGFVISGGGTTAAATGSATVANTVTGTLNFAYVDPSSGQGLLGVAFPRCIPANAVNTGIVVTAPAGGTGTTLKAVTVWGYQV